MAIRLDHVVGIELSEEELSARHLEANEDSFVEKKKKKKNKSKKRKHKERVHSEDSLSGIDCDYLDKNDISFHDLPFECQQLVLKRLDPKTLCAFSQTSKKSYQISHNRVILYDNIATNMRVPGNSALMLSGICSPDALNFDRYHKEAVAFKNQFRVHIDKQKALQKDADAKIAYEKFAPLLIAFFPAFRSFIGFLLFFIFLILLSCRLDGVIGISYSSIMIPLYIDSAWILIGSFGTSILFRLGVTSRAVKESDSKNYLISGVYAYTVFVSFDTLFFRIVILSLVASITWFAVALFLRVTTAVFSWWLVGIPLILIIILASASFFFLCEDSTGIYFRAIDSFFLMYLDILSIIFVVFLTINLEEVVEWSWLSVLSPMIAYVSSLMVFFVIYGVFFRHKIHSMFRGDGLCATYTILFFLVPLLLLFLITLGRTLDGSIDMQFRVVFVPMYIIGGLFLVFLFIMEGTLCFELLE